MIAESSAFDIYQTPEWALLEREAASGVARLLCLNLEGGNAWVPLIIREWRGHPFAWSPYGYPSFIRHEGARINAQAVAKELSRQLGHEGILGAFIRLHPLADADIDDFLTDYGSVVTHGPTASIDLRYGLDAAWGAMRARLRTDVRRLRNEGYSISTTWDRLDDFKVAYRATMDRVNADSYYYFPDSYWDKLRAFPPGWVGIVSVLGPNGDFAGGGIFTLYGPIAGYHLGATHTDYLSAQPTKLMFWSAAELAHASAADYLHLGGGLGAQRDGLHQLKSGFGRHEAIYRTLRVVAVPDASSRVRGGKELLLRAERFPPD